MLSSASHGWLHQSGKTGPSRPYLVAATIAAALFVAWYLQPTNLPGTFFLKQDLPILCLMTAAATLFPYLRLGQRWERELQPSAKAVVAGVLALLVVGVAGHWLVMQAYDLSRDEALATLAAEQIGHGMLATPIPEEWQPFGEAMLPVYFFDRVNPGLAWVSAYLPVNAAFQAIAGAVVHPALANPVLLIVGLFALWLVARRLWPSRRDAAVVATLLAATSSQLIVTSMTSYAMTGHFVLNMIWLALFLRRDGPGVVGALLVGFLAVGLHQLHFHPMFVAPFMLWLVLRREWGKAAIYGLGYAAIVVFWFLFYPQWLLTQVDPAAIIDRPDRNLIDYVLRKFLRLFQLPLSLGILNFARFIAWQNILLVPLALAAWPVLRERRGWKESAIFPLALGCLIGLIVPVLQGHGWGYRYFAGLIGSFCLLAGYGWIRLVPEQGDGRPWTVFKAACVFTLAVQLPLQLVMAHSFVEPYARLYKAARAAPVDVVLVDTSAGLFSQDIAQNSVDFEQHPKIMDLAYVPDDALISLCRTKKVALIDAVHYRKTGMVASPVSSSYAEHMAAKRRLLEQLDCAPPLKLAD